VARRRRARPRTRRRALSEAQGPVAPRGLAVRRTRERYQPKPLLGPDARWWLRQISWVLGAALLGLGIRAFGFEAYRIPTGSMLQTLLVGDHLFVNKFSYGPRVPGTNIRIPGLRDPALGDVVVFTVAHEGQRIYPADERPELRKIEFVKRIIGLPGDRIEVRGGLVFVNGAAVRGAKTSRDFVDSEGRSLDVYRASIGGHSFEVLSDPDVAAGIPGEAEPNAGPSSVLRVPAGRYFMMGDNWDYSADSREWGTVRDVDIKGPVSVLYWSWDYGGSYWRLFDPRASWEMLTTRMRWSRIGQVVD